MLKERLTLLRTTSPGDWVVGVVFHSGGDFRHASFGSMKLLKGNVVIFGGRVGSSFYKVYRKG
jgi:hypothetical protein